MSAPIKTMLKDDIVWLGTHRCKHKHTYLEHYDCFVAEKPKDSPYVEKVGFFDIESTGFKADYDFMLSYCILGEDGELISNIVTEQEVHDYTFDKRLVSDLGHDLLRFNRIVVYYGGDHRFDLPFSRTRAIKHDVDFPLYKDIFVTDVWAIAKYKLCLSRKSLANICSLFDIPCKQHPGDPNIWMRAQAGNQKDLDYIMVHNKEDVYSLKALYDKIKPYANINRSSI